MLPTTTTTGSAFLQQVLPLIVLFVVPALALRLLAFIRPRLMAFGSIFPRLWGSTIHGENEERDDAGGKKPRRARTRAEQQLLAGWSRGEDVYFPGLVNMSGTHCFMNSTLQALASLSHLPPYLHAIRTRAEALDVPTPVVDALIDLLAALNTPTPTQTPLRAVALVEALCTPPPPSSSSASSYSSSSSSSTTAASILSAFWGTHNTSTAGGASKKATALLASHEHQDAQELFQLLSECVREEGARVWAEARSGRMLGLASASGFGGTLPSSSPFDGLTATRRACVRCGYTAAIRHFAFDSVQLALDVGGGVSLSTPLPALLRAYTAPEVLQDCPCRRCELRATGRRLEEEVRRLEAAASSAKSQQEENEEGTSTGLARHRRLKTVRRLEARVRRALDAGRIEEEELVGEWGDWGGTGDALKGVKMERVAGGVCTRQSMFGRPPPILALHLNRSVHTGYRVAKNGAFVSFPEILDMTPYATGGEMSSDFVGLGDRGEREKGRGRCLYRLAAVVCHYGAHSFGHYVCYRRAPVLVSSLSPSSASSASTIAFSSAPSSSSTGLSPSPSYTPAPPTSHGSSGTGTGWLRISDARVERCRVEQVLAEGSAAFMLYYERVVGDGGDDVSSSSSPTPISAASAAASTSLNEKDEAVGDSAETIRPGPSLSASTSTSTSAAAVPFPGEERRGVADTTVRARVVRSVSLSSRLGTARTDTGTGAGQRTLVGGGSLASTSSSSASPSVSLAEREKSGMEGGAATAARGDGDIAVSASASEADEGEDGWERVESLAGQSQMINGTAAPPQPPAASHEDAENVATPDGKPKNRRKKKGAAARQKEFLKAISVN
ncbi:USP domain-containing protein [Favolaschia claudopus]|uniref:ubiquitinyl hydrolase 1 n=1 Tax=Favolaschia claudopus TaxID=2862362 RepID=A0AAV9Z075_9AGAR